MFDFRRKKEEEDIKTPHRWAVVTPAPRSQWYSHTKEHSSWRLWHNHKFIATSVCNELEMVGLKVEEVYDYSRAATIFKPTLCQDSNKTAIRWNLICYQFSTELGQVVKCLFTEMNWQKKPCNTRKFTFTTYTAKQIFRNSSTNCDVVVAERVQKQKHSPIPVAWVTGQTVV